MAVLTVVARELPQVYADNVRDQRPRDTANVFGFRVYEHLWAATGERHADYPGAHIVEFNSAKHIQAGPIKVAMHKLGHSVHDDIYSCYPEGSRTQRGYGERNSNQLTLFDAAPVPPPADDRAYALRDLVVGHFGNPDDGLAKWYVGAWTYDEDGNPGWAWVRQQPIVGAVDAPVVIAYDQREVDPLDIRPRVRPRPASADRPAGV